MGGADPNLADLAVFGTLRAVEVRNTTMEKHENITIMILLDDPPFRFRLRSNRMLLGSGIRRNLRGPNPLSSRALVRYTEDLDSRVCAQGSETHKVIMQETELKPWYDRMAARVGERSCARTGRTAE
jgi:hypothetical protein